MMRMMRRLIVGAAVAGGVLVLAPLTKAFVCDIPTAGCSNGMFNQGKCECECIEPFCPDDTGDCRLPSNSCGGNPWTQCTRGVNCPWWPNPLKAESCTTGPSVPAGTWDIFNTERACCNTNYPYSDVCGAFTKTQSEPPTKYPTISAPDDDDYEIVPIEFQVGGLPKDIKMRELKDEMKIVLQRILVRLADRIDDLKISKIEEKFVPKGNRNMQATRDLSIYFNVYVIRSDDKRFGPIIINELRDNYGEVREQMIQFTDTRYIGANVEFNLCTSAQGEFTLCAKDKPTPKPVPAPPVAPSPSRGQRPPKTFSDGTGGANSGGGGVPGWAVALIVIIILICGCCVAYYFWMNMRDKYDDKGMTNNIYLDAPKAKNRDRGYDERSYAQTTRTARTNRTRKSRRPRELDYDRDDYEDYDPNAGAEIVLYNNENPEFDDFTINTYGTKRTEVEDSVAKVGRDPTMYIPGHEDKPDPESSTDVLMITDGTTSTRQYYEDPPLKPKRDPTMYVDGGASERSSYTEDLESTRKPRRDPTMYVNEATEPDNFMNDRSNRSSDPYGMNDIDEASEYYGGYEDVGQDNHVNSSGRDPSFYLSADNASQSEESFRTQEPSVASRSPSRSKRKKKKKTRQYQ